MLILLSNNVFFLTYLLSNSRSNYFMSSTITERLQFYFVNVTQTMRNAKLLLYFGALTALIVVEATVNVCVPTHLADSVEGILDALKDILNEIKEILIVADNAPNIVLDHLDADIHHPAIRLFGTLDNIKIYNLSKFEICLLENIIANSTDYQFDLFNLTFPNIRVEGFYDLVSGDLGDIFDLYGSGDFWLELRDFSVSVVNFTFDVTDDICFPLTIQIDIREAGNWFKHFLYDEELEELFNAAITDILPETLKILWGEYGETIELVFKEYIEGIFANHNAASLFSRSKKVKSGGEDRSGRYCLDSDEIIRLILSL